MLRILENPNVIVVIEVGRSDDVIVALNDEREAEGLEN